MSGKNKNNNNKVPPVKSVGGARRRRNRGGNKDIKNVAANWQANSANQMKQRQANLKLRTPTSGKKLKGIDFGKKKMDFSKVDNDAVVYKVDARNPLQSFCFNDKGKMSTQSSSTIVSPVLLYSSLVASIIPVLTAAIQAGFEQYGAAISEPSTAYFAFVYMIQLLEVYVLNINPLAVQVPKWIALLGNALRPKNVTFKSGSLEFKWQYTSGTISPPTIMLGSGDGPVIVNYYIRVPGTSTDATGYPTMNNPSPYSQAAGEAAFGVLCEYFNGQERLHPMWKSVAFNAGGEFNRDASAFSYASPILGIGSGSGSWGGFVGNEVPITHPMLGCFTAQSALVRYPK